MSISQGRATTPAPVSSCNRTLRRYDFRPQPEAASASRLKGLRAGSPPKGTGRVFLHGVAIDRLVGIKHTAASAVSPCTKIATVAHAGIGQRLPTYFAR
jgi:hypothetical protein